MTTDRLVIRNSGSLPPIGAHATQKELSLGISKSEPAFGQFRQLPWSYELSSGATQVAVSTSVDLGNLEVWPANGNSHSKVRRVTAPGGGYIRGLNVSPNALDDKTTARPRLLQELEKYLEQELSLLSVPDDQASEARLRVYGEVFECITENFKTYKPLLAGIKREYDLMLSHQSSQLEMLYPLQAKLATLKDETLFVINSLKTEYEEKIAQLEKTLQEARSSIAAAENRADDYARDRDRTAKEYQRLQDETREHSETNRLLVQSLAHHKQAAASQDDWHKKHDELVGRLRQTEKALATLTEKLAAAVSRHEYDRVEEEYQRLRANAQEIAEELKRCQQLYQEAQERIAVLTVENAMLTPRPEWVVLAGQSCLLASITGASRGDITTRPMTASITGAQLKAAASSTMGGAGAGRGQHAIGSRPTSPPPDTSNAQRDSEQHLPTQSIVSRMLSEMDRMQVQVQSYKIKLPNNDAYFEGLGVGEDVPEYLRFEGRLRNRRIPKGELEAVIKRMWKFKEALEKKKQSETLPHCLYQFLLKQWKTKELVAEWAYNIIDACKRFSYDADIDLFYRILTGEISEDVYDEQIRLVDSLQAFMVRWDAGGDRGEGKMSKEHFKEVLRKFFINKDQDALEKLGMAADADQPGPYVFYRKLFEEDGEGDQGAFIELVRAQHLHERHHFLEQLEVALLEADTQATGQVAVQQVREVLSHLDSECTRAEIDEAITTGFGRQKGTVTPNDMKISISLFMQKYRAGVVRMKATFRRISVMVGNTQHESLGAPDSTVFSPGLSASPSMPMAPSPSNRAVNGPETSPTRDKSTPRDSKRRNKR
eukprot:CAMPEP_0184363258 /NCGR_PEP_ID=MMETSP1089-20130417/138814_1 /TAXON_ID=38269 ORGANISM="Gloeochaete wittrockiana, Strain SAG46.84" /NCGR_SAMPLE_ID=MMETSP1089 /ASSEMBLY_ACC=CAM_ASM_000445 /LENGTH=826 /DNA_ID=CAMNT_0026703671 /DNA_START=15 /DNA_END=2495 /DNA_ORIENTATION=+